MRFLFFAIGLISCFASLAGADGVQCQTAQMVGFLDLPAPAEGIAIKDNYAFIAGGDSGDVYIADISDPSNPILLATYTSPGAAEQIAVWGDVLVIANVNLRIEFIDISVIHSPQLIEAYMTQRRYLDIEARDGYLYATGYAFSHFNIWDIRSPDSIEFVGLVPDVRFGIQIAFHNDLVYLADTGLKTIDASDPTSPVTIDDFELDGFDINSVGVFTADNGRLHALTANIDHLSIIDINTPFAHEVVFQQEDWIGFAPTQIIIQDTTAYLGFDYPGIIQVLDLSNPSSPLIIAEHQTRGPALDFEIKDDGLIFVAAGAGGMQIIDSSHYPSNSAIAEFELDSRFENVFDLIKNDNLLYMAAGRDGLVILDVTNPRDPIRLSSIPYTTRALSVEIVDGLVYLGTAGIGIRIIDAQDPMNPVEIGTIPTAGDNPDMLVVADHLLAINKNYAIESYSLVNPSKPELTGSYEGFRGRSLSYSQGLLFATSNSSISDRGAYIFNCVDPSNLKLLHHLNSDFAAQDAVGSHQYLYVSSGNQFAPETNGIYVFDIREIASPVEVGFIPLDLTFDLELIDNTLFACAHDDGLRIYDVSDGAYPTLTGWHSPFFGQAFKIDTDGYIAYLSNGTNDASIIDLRSCEECLADMDLDQDMDFFDVSLFLSGYYDSLPMSDLNGDGKWNFYDVSAFLVSYHHGCK